MKGTGCCWKKIKHWSPNILSPQSRWFTCWRHVRLHHKKFRMDCSCFLFGGAWDRNYHHLRPFFLPTGPSTLDSFFRWKVEVLTSVIVQIIWGKTDHPSRIINWTNKNKEIELVNHPSTESYHTKVCFNSNPWKSLKAMFVSVETIVLARVHKFIINNSRGIFGSTSKKIESNRTVIFLPNLQRSKKRNLQSYMKGEKKTWLFQNKNPKLYPME